jgi:hypothetical protein
MWGAIIGALVGGTASYFGNESAKDAAAKAERHALLFQAQNAGYNRTVQKNIGLMALSAVGTYAAISIIGAALG